MEILFIFLLYSCLILFNYADEFSIVTDQPAYRGILAAFGDENADRLVDIFVIDQSGKEVDVLLSGQNSHFEQKNLINRTADDNVRISGIMLADFNADLQMDILVVLKDDTSGDITAEVYWGGDKEPTPFQFNTTFTDEPVLFDYDGNMLPDLLVETEGQWIVWRAVVNKSFVPHAVKETRPTMHRPNSGAFINLDSDYAADLFLRTHDGFEVFANGNVTADAMKIYQNSSELLFDALSSFGDFNQDGIIDHVLPVCVGDKCSISVYNSVDKKWYTMLKELGKGWKFMALIYRHFNFPPTLHVGDYDMDGYPDAVTVIRSEKGEQKVLLLSNVACESASDCGGFGRQFQARLLELPPELNSTLTATFYDINEDGTLDIVMTATSVDKELGQNVRVPKLIFLRNNVAEDTCFLKVTVLSGVCSSVCHNRQPYGVNVPGPTVKYNTTKADGSTQTSSVGQLSQSCHFALQLPYITFGLGQTPNFVDKVGVGVAKNSTNKFLRYRVWQQIIPNSQLVVNPNPLDDLSGWEMTLFVMPSHQIWLTGIALAATCGFVAFIVGALHLHEKREDSKEKKQESQKFHFDAM